MREKMSGLLKVKEVKKLLLSSKPLYYCKNNTFNQIIFLPSVDSLLQESKMCFQLKFLENFHL